MINKFKNIIFITSILFAFTFVSCKREFDEPAMVVPKVDFSGDTTIKYRTISDVKALLPLGSIIDTINENFVIKAVVTANDESGNLYKQLFIQDATGAIEFRLDKNSIYNNLKVGQRVYIKCKGLYIGKYEEAFQLGYYYNGTVGRLPETLMNNHIFLDSLPGAKPIPLKIKISDISLDLHTGMLIELDSVKFTEKGLNYAEAADYGSRTIYHYKKIDPSMSTAIVRTSNYAKFAKVKVPETYFNIICILTRYRSDKQLLIRDIKDVNNFVTIGSATEPDNIAYPDVVDNPVSSLNQTFENITNNVDYSEATWLNANTIGTRKWRGATYQTEKYIKATAYGSSDNTNVTCLVTPPVIYNSSLKLSFKTAIEYYKHNGLSVFLLYNYNPSNLNQSVWVDITNKFTIAGQSNSNYQWVDSKVLNLSDVIPSTYNGNFYICFRYTGDKSANTTTFRIDDILIQQ